MVTRSRRVRALPDAPVPGTEYFVQADGDAPVYLFIVGDDGVAHPIVGNEAEAADAAATRANAAATAANSSAAAAQTIVGSGSSILAAAASVGAAYRRTIMRVISGRRILGGLRDSAGRRLFLAFGLDGRTYQPSGSGALETIATQAEVGLIADQRISMTPSKDGRLRETIFRRFGGALVKIGFRDAATKRLLAFVSSEGQFFESDGGGGFKRAGGGLTLASAADRAYTHSESTDASAPASLASRLAWFPRLGQSLAQGANQDANLVFTTVPLYPGKVVMPSVGSNPNGAAWNTLVDAYETIKETGHVAFLNRLHKRILDETGVDALIGGAISAQGGTGFLGLRRGTTAWTQFLYNLVQARDVARARGWGFYVPGVIWEHGNEDTPVDRDRYVNYLQQLQADLEADIRAVTGQSEPVFVWIGQVDSAGSSAFAFETGVPLAQLAVAQHEHRSRLIGPHYDIERDGAPSVHPSYRGYLWLGERYADNVFTDWLCAGQRPFAPVDWRWASTTEIDVTFAVPVAPIVVDTSGTIVTTAGLGNGCGFEFDDASGSAPAITSVALTGTTGKVLRVTLAGAPTGPCRRLLYAMRKAGNDGPVAGARGCIRDSGTATSTRQVDGSAAAGGNGRPLYNWAARFVLRV